MLPTSRFESRSTASPRSEEVINMTTGTFKDLHKHCPMKGNCDGTRCRRRTGKTAGDLPNTSEPQKREPTKPQRRRAARIAAYGPATIRGERRPGSSKKPYPLGHHPKRAR